MTLHPWPLNDSSTRDRAAVLWTGPHGMGLLTDSLALPLRFLPEEASLASVTAASVERKAHVAFNASALFCMREIGSRFGTGI